MSKIKIKAVFFDMDGTVIDTEPIHAYAWAEGLKRSGITVNDDFLIRCIGLNVPEMKKLFISEIGSGEQFDSAQKLASEISREYKNTHGIKVKSGFNSLINFLKENKIKSYIVTSTVRESALRDLKRTGIIEFFDGFVCFGDYEKGKPNPEPYLTALKLSGEDIDNCIAVEDSQTGLISALGARLRSIYARDKGNVDDDIIKQAFAEVSSLDEIIGIIKDL